MFSLFLPCCFCCEFVRRDVLTWISNDNTVIIVLMFWMFRIIVPMFYIHVWIHSGCLSYTTLSFALNVFTSYWIILHDNNGSMITIRCIWTYKAHSHQAKNFIDVCCRWHRGNTFPSHRYDLCLSPCCCYSVSLTPCRTWDVFHPSQPMPDGFPWRVFSHF